MRRLRSMWRTLFRSRQLDADMQEEMRFHIEMETQRLMRERGLDAEEARRQAYIRFGGVEKYKEASRDVRGLQWLGAMSLDARLAMRMLVKHRWMTLVGGFATAVAIAIGATFFEFTTEVLNPALPLEEGERVVALQYATGSPENPERRVLQDFLAWREQLTTVEELSAFRTVQHNLTAGGAAPEPIKVAEMTASGFTVARTPPLLGRTLLPPDDVQGAPPVIVIGHHVWTSRFGSDPRVIGRALNLGGIAHTIVGVMPDGFRFPVSHQYWIPLRAGEGSKVYLFGRLARGATLEQAQAELTTVVQRDASRRRGERLRATVLPYTREHVDLTDPALVWLLRIAQFAVAVLALVVAVNLAILTYARTVTRLGEIALRTALGASRARILTQLFLESLALTFVSALAGLALTRVAARWMQSVAIRNGQVPFWIDFGLNGMTVLYALALAIVAAAVMGVLPGLKATDRNATANLNALNARAGTRLGPTWTALVVAQVALAVAVLPVAVYFAWPMVRMETVGAGFAAEQFVVATVAVNGDEADVDPRRIALTQRSLMARVEAEPSVSGVTFSSGVPGFAGDALVHVAGDADPHDVGVLRIAPELFDVYRATLIAGRAFTASDLGEANAVIVNQTFVRKLLDNRSALGQRFRYATNGKAREYQIVGVVRDFPAFSAEPGSDGQPTVYHPAAPGESHPFILSVRFDGAIPGNVVERLRGIGAEVDPALQLRRVLPLTRFYDDVRALWRYLAWGVGLVTISILLLSAAGIYALMSFTVAQRTREIGIRTALGAHPRQLLLGIFGRAMRQLALGLGAGSLLATVLFATGGFSIARAMVLLLAVAVLMLIVGLLAAFAPARRTLRIDAIEALAAEG